MWITKNWVTGLALATQVPTIWTFLKWALDWRGRVDALAETYHEIGGWHAMIGYILDPPPWLYPLAFVVGLLIWWNAHRNQKSSQEQLSNPVPEGVQLKIMEVKFGASPRQDGRYELSIICRLSNTGYPTTLKNWELSINRQNSIKLHHLRGEASPFFTLEPLKNGKLEDFTRNPFATGKESDVIFTYIHRDSVKDAFDRRGTVFTLSLEDIKSRRIETNYILP